MPNACKRCIDSGCHETACACICHPDSIPEDVAALVVCPSCGRSDFHTIGCRFIDRSIPPAEAATVACFDCGLPYGGEGWLDLVLPRCQWLEINPDDGGILCANCIVKRASKLPGALSVSAVIVFLPEWKMNAAEELKR